MDDPCKHKYMGLVCLELLTDEEKMAVLVEHYSWLLNFEFVWNSNKLPDVAVTEGSSTSVSVELIHKTLSKMKCSMAAGASGIIAEKLKAAG